MKKKTNMRIPQMFYLRKMTITITSPSGNKQKTTVYIYWNYRNTQRGVVNTIFRRVAKQVILTNHPEAEFWR